MPRAHYTDAQLTRAIVRDLVNDYRTTLEHIASGAIAKHGGDVEKMRAYAEKCRQDVGKLFKHRRAIRLNQWGWPEKILESQL